MCFVWVCFPSLCVCLVDPFNQFWGIFLKYFFDFMPLPPPRTYYYHILYLLGWFYNFLFSLFHLCIFFFTMEGFLQLLSPNPYVVLLIYVI